LLQDGALTSSALFYAYLVIAAHAPVLESSRTSHHPRGSRTILKSLVLALRAESLALRLVSTVFTPSLSCTDMDVIN